jgi:hypothetical protein
MPAKKRKKPVKPVKKKAVSEKRKQLMTKAKEHALPQEQTLSQPRPDAAQAVPTKVEKLITQEEAAREFFAPHKMTFGSWARRYSPVLVTMFIALLTYFYLVFYLFYPTTIIQGHYLQLLLLLVFIFLIAGLLIYLGLRTELLFIRILSFIFVFIIFTFLLLFILIANSMGAGAP